MLRKTVALLALGLIAMASSDAGAAITPAITDQSQVTGSIPPTTASFGFDFTANSAIQVTALGVYSVGNSVVDGQVINLIDLGPNPNLSSPPAGTVIATTTIQGVITPNAFNYSTIGTITLNTTDTYAVVTVFTTGQPAVGTGTPVYTPDIVEKFAGYNTTNPGRAPNTSFPSVIAANFLYQPSTVPEPASIAMVGVGLAGVALARRRMARRSA